MLPGNGFIRCLQSGISGGAFGLSAIQVLALFGSLAVQLAILQVFGVSAETDAYWLAVAPPLLLLTVVNEGANAFALPALMVRRSMTESPADTSQLRFVVKLALVSAFMLIGVALLIGVTYWFLLGNKAAAYRTTVITLLALFTLSAALGCFANSALQAYLARGDFFPTSFVHLLPPSVSLTFILLWGHEVGIVTVAYASILGSAAQCIALFGGMAHQISREPLTHRAPFRMSGIVASLMVSIPLTLPLQIVPLTERSIAAAFDEGVVTYIGISWALGSAAMALVMRGLLTVDTARLAQIALGQMAEFERAYGEAIVKITFLVVACAGALALIAPDLFRLLEVLLVNKTAALAQASSYFRWHACTALMLALWLFLVRSYFLVPRNSHDIPKLKLGAFFVAYVATAGLAAFIVSDPRALVATSTGFAVMIVIVASRHVYPAKKFSNALMRAVILTSLSIFVCYVVETTITIAWQPSSVWGRASLRVAVYTFVLALAWLVVRRAALKPLWTSAESWPPRSTKPRVP